ncbi:MAG: hypothetical protein H3C54_07100 [Taibaiella sp.]|nr:hypothetical protein [Taibaiella sp.]
MTNKDKKIRQEVKKYIDTANEKTVIMIHAMLKAGEKADSREEELLEQAIEQRFAEYEKGKAKVINLEELEDYARTSLRKSRRVAQ